MNKFAVYDSICELQQNYVDVINTIPRTSIQVISYRNGLNFLVPCADAETADKRTRPIFFINWKKTKDQQR